jgi:DNA-3-methyladenine glycosylase I
MKSRCEWPGSDDLYIEYHDNEWGVPLHDDRKIFEMLVLGGAQAGLNWLTILKKRNNYRMAFDNFDPTKVARYRNKKVQDLLANTGIIRNERKIRSAIQNARAFLEVQAEFGSFDTYIWQFVDGRPIHNSWKSLIDLPSQTRESEAMSKDLRRRGFSFIGPTICYAHMQATGMVNDHIVSCFRYKEIARIY